MSLAGKRSPAPDDRPEPPGALVDVLFSSLPERDRRSGSVPSIVLENRRRRARDRLLTALESRGAMPAPPGRREELQRLVHRWATRDFEDGFLEVEDFEIACAQERERLEAEASGDRARVLAVQEQAHRRTIVAAYGRIELRGLQMSARVHQELDIAYVPLFIEDPSQEKTVRLDEKLEIHHIPRLLATEVVRLHSRVLIVGAPGSGKTTLVAYLASSAAAGKLREQASWEDDPVPFVVPVRSLAAPHLDAATLASAAECDADFVREVLAQGRAMVLVDGLDEAGTERLEALLPSIQAFARAYPKNKVVLTTRPGNAPGDARTCVEGFAATRLLPMARDEVYSFIDRWCRAAEISIQKDRQKAQEDAERAATDLKGRVQTSRAVERLAETPLMASVLCTVHRFLGQRVPERRAALYEACTNVLLYEWDRAKFPEGSFIGQLDAQMKRVLLGGMARSMHESGLAELAKDEVVKRFAERLPAIGHTETEAEAIVAEIQERSGLLIERRAGFFAFSHLTFQEYLTAVDMVRDGAYDPLVARHADPWWHEVIALSAGLPSADAGRIVRGLLKADGRKVSTGTILAAQCLDTAVELPASLRERVEQRVSKVIPPHSDRDVLRVVEFGNVAGPVLLRSLSNVDPNAVARSATALGLLKYEPACGALARLMSDSRMTSERIELVVGENKVDAHEISLASTVTSALANLARFSQTSRTALQSALPSARNDSLGLLISATFIRMVTEGQSKDTAKFFKDIAEAAKDLRAIRDPTTEKRWAKRFPKRAAHSD